MPPEPPARAVAIPVADGEIPTAWSEPSDASRKPALFVVPSIFGAAPDLLKRLVDFAEAATIVCPDPFWRAQPGVIPYPQREAAFARLKDFDLRACIADLGAALDWTHARCNGRVIGLGICFGGPFVLRFAGEQRLDGVVAWHGSRMEQHLERAAAITCPVRLHYGGADPVTPPDAIEATRAALAHHPDVDIVVHPGADHGFSHDGESFDPRACRAGLDAVGELLETCS